MPLRRFRTAAATRWPLGVEGRYSNSPKQCFNRAWCSQVRGFLSFSNWDVHKMVTALAHNLWSKPSRTSRTTNLRGILPKIKVELQWKGWRNSWLVWPSHGMVNSLSFLATFRCFTRKLISPGTWTIACFAGGSSLRRNKRQMVVGWRCVEWWPLDRETGGIFQIDGHRSRSR